MSDRSRNDRGQRCLPSTRICGIEGEARKFKDSACQNCKGRSQFPGTGFRQALASWIRRSGGDIYGRLVAGFLGWSVEHPANLYGKPFTVIGLAKKLDARV